MNTPNSSSPLRAPATFAQACDDVARAPRRRTSGKVDSGSTTSSPALAVRPAPGRARTSARGTPGRTSRPARRCPARAKRERLRRTASSTRCGRRPAPRRWRSPCGDCASHDRAPRGASRAHRQRKREQRGALALTASETRHTPPIGRETGQRAARQLRIADRKPRKAGEQIPAQPLGQHERARRGEPARASACGERERGRRASPRAPDTATGTRRVRRSRSRRTAAGMPPNVLQRDVDPRHACAEQARAECEAEPRARRARAPRRCHRPNSSAERDDRQAGPAERREAEDRRTRRRAAREREHASQRAEERLRGGRCARRRTTS